MLWEHLTTLQHKDKNKNTLVILSIASIEQHGPSLPVCVDSYIGWSLCNEIEKRLSEKILLLPQIKICYSQHHMDFDGSLTVNHETISNYIYGILQSVIFHGYHKILILNSHGGNQAIMQVIIEKLGNQYKDVDIFGTSWWQLCNAELAEIQESGFMGNGHAAEFEYSLMEYLYPELIDYANKPKKETYPNIVLSQAQGDLIKKGAASHLLSFAEMTEDGTYGIVTKTSKEKGKKIFEFAVKSIEQLILNIHSLTPRAKR